MREPLTVVNFIDELIQDLESIKAKQFVGEQSLRTYRTSSNNAYDLTTTLTLGQEKRYRLTFDFDKATEGALLEMNIYYRLDDPNVMAAPVARTPPTNPHVAVYWYRETLGDTYTTWIIIVKNISFSLTPVPYIKIFIDGTDSGSWNIVQI